MNVDVEFVKTVVLEADRLLFLPLQQYFQSVNMSDSDFVDVEGDEDSFTRKKVTFLQEEQYLTTIVCLYVLCMYINRLYYLYTNPDKEKCGLCTCISKCSLTFKIVVIYHWKVESK